MRYLWTEDTGAGLHFWQLASEDEGIAGVGRGAESCREYLTHGSWDMLQLIRARSKCAKTGD